MKPSFMRFMAIKEKKRKKNTLYIISKEIHLMKNKRYTRGMANRNSAAAENIGETNGAFVCE